MTPIYNDDIINIAIISVHRNSPSANVLFRKIFIIIVQRTKMGVLITTLTGKILDSLSAFETALVRGWVTLNYSCSLVTGRLNWHPRHAIDDSVGER